MNTPVRINALEVQDFKKVVAIALECDGEALTVIGGDNAQGKTTFLEAIAWAAGGDNFRPSQPVRDGAEELKIRVEFSNGVIAERTGEDGKLKVTDSTGKRGGQALLKAFISQFSLELDDFVNASAKEKAKMLLALYPELGPELDKLNLQIKATYDDRLVLGRQKDQKAKYAAELPFIPDAPLELLTGSEMTSKMQQALAHNAEVERLRNNKVRLNNELDAEIRERSRLRAILEKLNEKIDDLQNKVDLANKVAADATIMDTTAIQAKLEEMDAINAKVRTNAEKSRAERDAEDLAEQYSECSRKIETLRAKRLALLSKVEMPLPGLEISDDGDLVYNGRPWDGCSGAEQLKVAVAIAAAIKPECGFVLVDGLERMSKATLREFGEWATERNIQIIGTRVSDGDECSIIIEDGSIRF